MKHIPDPRTSNREGQMTYDLRPTNWRLNDDVDINWRRRSLTRNIRVCVCVDVKTQDNTQYLSMVDTLLSTDGYYFSTTCDLTHTLQRLSNTSPDFKNLPLHERVSQSFFTVANLPALRSRSRSDVKQYSFVFVESTTCGVIESSFV